MARTRTTPMTPGAPDLPGGPLFLARITAASHPNYSFQEAWLTPAGTYADKAGGRFGTIGTNPGTSTGPTFAVNDYSLCRQAEGAAGLAWELYALGGSSGSGVTVAEVDGSPSYTGATTLRFDQADGFVLSQPSAGVVRVDIAAATASQAGIVSTGAQTFGGFKQFGSIGVDGTIDVTSDATIGGKVTVNGGRVLVNGTGADSPGGGTVGFRFLGGATHASIYALPSGGGGAPASFYLVTGDGSGAVADLFVDEVIAATGYRAGISTGQTGTLGPGATVTGGIVTALGSGSFLSDPGNGLAAGSYP